MSKLKLRYMWKDEWYYIDLYKDNTAIKFTEYEERNKTTRFQRFIGILDKNKVEIYEGDILGHKDKRKKYSEIVLYAKRYGSSCEDTTGFNFNDNLEVIGNIYEKKKEGE